MLRRAVYQNHEAARGAARRGVHHARRIDTAANAGLARLPARAGAPSTHDAAAARVAGAIPSAQNATRLGRYERPGAGRAPPADRPRVGGVDARAPRQPSAAGVDRRVSRHQPAAVADFVGLAEWLRGRGRRPSAAAGVFGWRPQAKHLPLSQCRATRIFGRARHGARDFGRRLAQLRPHTPQRAGHHPHAEPIDDGLRDARL